MVTLPPGGARGTVLKVSPAMRVRRIATRRNRGTLAPLVSFSHRSTFFFTCFDPGATSARGRAKRMALVKEGSVANTNRREILRLMGYGGVVFASSLLRGTTGCSNSGGAPARTRGGTSNDASDTSVAPPDGTPRGASADFFFLQVSDTHWGFSGPMVNPEAQHELPNVVSAISASPIKPDFIVFTGDLTHNTDDVAVRKQRLNEFKQIVGGLTQPLRFMPGEHDAAADGGAAYKEVIGDLRWSFDHQGIHFVAIDN